MAESFYWHDYETSGIVPTVDRPVQFAGVRTDNDLNIIGEPLVIYCQLTDDILPHPMACAVTGITPQLANDHGLSERDFIAQILKEMSQATTCTVGYNNIRFDDEFTRNILYRNFHDAYEREYRNNNTRWDLIDVVRLCCALRPEGIEWPFNEEGKPSFRLELLTQENGIEHAGAHDALADVTATIALAKLLKQRKPRLFDYALKLRNKHFVAKMLANLNGEPILHVSAKLPSEHYCTTLVLPVAIHPGNKNGVICVDLRYDPEPLFELSAAEISRLLYLPASERTSDTVRIPLKVIHINKCPIVATQKLLDEAAIERIALDVSACQRHAEKLRKNLAWLSKINDIFALPSNNDNEGAVRDVDEQLYGGGFFSSADKQLMLLARESSAQELLEATFSFKDPRLVEMLFRYRARNYPQSLNHDEQAQWLEHCRDRLCVGPSVAEGSVVSGRRLGLGPGKGCFGFSAFDLELTELEKMNTQPELVQALKDYADSLRVKLSL